MFRLLLSVLFIVVLVACQPSKRIPVPPTDKKDARETPDKPQEANDFFLVKRAPAGVSALSYSLYAKARQQADELPVYSSMQGRFLDASERAALAGWTFLGPGNIGGRTRQLVIDPGAPDTVYAAAVSGGVWKSTDAGVSWAPLDDLMANLAVSALVMDPGNSQVLYAGTGEGFFNGDAVRGAGVFRTADAGNTWTQLSSTLTADFFYVNDLKISAWDSNRIYAATNTGVFRSTDAGVTWTAMNLNDGTNRLETRCTQLQLRTDLTNQDVLFASCFSTDDVRTDHMIWRSLNAQATSPAWMAVHAPTGMGRSSMALAPSDQNIIYVLASHDGSVKPEFRNGLQAVYRSTDGGDTWTTRTSYDNAQDIFGDYKLKITQLSDPASLLCWNQGFRNQGWYDNVIAVDPVDPDRIWTGGIDLLMSPDGGISWQLMSYWWLNPQDGGYYSDSPHADQHAIVFHPDYDGLGNRHMYVANDGGIYRATYANVAGGTSSSQICPAYYSDAAFMDAILWINLNNGYGVTQFYHGDAYPDGTAYLGGTQDNGTLRGRDSRGADAWEKLRGGDGGYVSIDPNNTQVLYSSYVYLSLEKSTDGGINWANATNGIDTSLDSSFLFITPHAMDPGNANNLWIGGSYLWRTTNAAANWVQASTDNGVSLSAVGISPVNSNAVIAGFVDGTVRHQTAALSTTGSTAWPAVTLMQNCYISSVRFAPGSDQVAYATSSTFGCSHIFKTSDGGASWTSINNNFPDIPAHDLLVDPGNASRLFVGSDLGMFVSVDGGMTWAQENSGFANVVVESLDMENNSGQNILYAFTHGRGVWRATLSGTEQVHSDGFEYP